MAKRKIKITPKSTGDKKPKPNKPKPKPKPAPVENPQDLKLWDAYQRAVANGQERKFLKAHPGFKARANATLPPKSGLGKINSDSAKLGQVQKAAEKAAPRQSQAASQAQNLQSANTAFGSAGFEIDPATGRTVYTQTESDPQRQIRESGEALSITGTQKAQDNLSSYQRFGSDPSQMPQGIDPFSSSAPPVERFGGGAGAAGASNALIQGYEAFDWQGSPEERQRIEEDVYSRLTRNVDRDYNQEFEQMEQRMYNRGIPLDPSNPAYKREMDALNEKYQAIKADARGQAVQLGGQELQRSYEQGLGSHQQYVGDTSIMYGIGQAANQTRNANQAQQFGQDVTGYETNLAGQGQAYNQALTTQQQQMAETAALQKMGMGYMGAPQLDYNAPEFMQTNPADLWLQRRGQNKQHEVGMMNAQANMMMAAKAGEGGEEEEGIPT